ncbi:DUF2169 family type VI secretion system accessory protein [Citrobacter freundii]|uniref:DUF2169 family type VI secretion system accessory protein n=1 Tax=Citrobacter freundii TaxID=546 RepID=UPI00200DEA52|nr:DUF2169 domain-containing protein [Citrobacter freundii]
MEIFNAAKHTAADTFTATDKEGREHLVVVIKATYKIPAHNQYPRPLLPAQPLIESDIYVGEPGYSAVLYEADYVRYKIKCDVLFNAQTYFTSTENKYQKEVRAVVGTIDKTLAVTGPRCWQQQKSRWIISEPQYVTAVSLHYGNAFGGEYIWQDAQGNEQRDIFIHNLVGTGYGDAKNKTSLINCRLPQVELLQDVVTSPDSRPAPGAFSVQPRNHPTRLQYAGTYDEYWLKEVSPFLPEDFDERYFQSAPPDQQTEYIRGGEKIMLVNMHKERPVIEFQLPHFGQIPVRILTMDYEEYELTPVVDTLYFEPDEERFSVVWRTSMPLKRRIQEIHTVAIGAVGKAWWQQRAAGGSGNCGGCKGKSDESKQVVAKKRGD